LHFASKKRVYAYTARNVCIHTDEGDIKQCLMSTSLKHKKINNYINITTINIVTSLSFTLQPHKPTVRPY